MLFYQELENEEKWTSCYLKLARKRAVNVEGIVSLSLCMDEWNSESSATDRYTSEAQCLYIPRQFKKKTDKEILYILCILDKKKDTTMRTITEIIIHCSATPEGKSFTVADIDRWHRQRGFRCIGYHYVIYLDGSIHQGRPIEDIGAHCKGHNAHSIGICYIGGLDAQGQSKDTRTPQQKEALKALVGQLKNDYPNAEIHGHNEFAHKACPCFDVRAEF